MDYYTSLHLFIAVDFAQTYCSCFQCKEMKPTFLLALTKSFPELAQVSLLAGQTDEERGVTVWQKFPTNNFE